MDEKLIACCGLDCSACPAYIATKNDNDDLRKKTASGWGSDEFPVSAEDINCAGCRDEALRWKFCQACGVRTCATGQGFATCAECADFACEKLEGILQMVGKEARARLEGLRAEPQA